MSPKTKEPNKKNEPTPVANTTPLAAPVETKKNHTVAWILGGCFVLILILITVMGILGWLAMRETKKALQKYEPTIQGVQTNVDKFNKEAEEWEKKAKQARESLPDIENMNVNMNGDMPIDFPTDENLSPGVKPILE